MALHDGGAAFAGTERLHLQYEIVVIQPSQHRHSADAIAADTIAANTITVSTMAGSTGTGKHLDM